MQLPLTSNSLIFWLDASEKFVNFSQNTNNFSSIEERVSGISCFSDAGAVPTWNRNMINGRPALSFNGSQNLYFNFDKRVMSSGVNIPIVMMAVAQTTVFSASGPVLFSLGSQTNPNATFTLSDNIAGGKDVFGGIRYDDLGNGDGIAAPIYTDSNWHLYTYIFDGLTLRARVDGVEQTAVKANISLTLNNRLSGDQIGIGDYTQQTATTFGHGYWTGNLASLVVYAGKNGDVDLNAEDYFLKLYNL
jgi:hypothetical protein